MLENLTKCEVALFITSLVFVITGAVATIGILF